MVNIVQLVSNSCSCSEDTAREYIEDELRNLDDLLKVSDLKVSDVEMACNNLGLDLDFMDYFIERLNSN